MRLEVIGQARARRIERGGRARRQHQQLRGMARGPGVGLGRFLEDGMGVGAADAE